MPSKKKPLTSIGARSYRAAPPPAPETPPPPERFKGRVVKLHEISASVLTHEVKTPECANGVKFIAGNPTDDPIGIDLTGGYLVPTGENQRLLVAGAENAVDGIAVVPSRGTATIELLTACMDHGKPGPDGRTKYTVADHPAPDVFQSVARRFADLACKGEAKHVGGGDRGQSSATRRLVRSSARRSP